MKQNLLASLRNQITAIHRAAMPLEAEDFYRLARSLEAYRDQVRDHLDGLPTTEDRATAEDQLYPAVEALVDEVDELVNQAVKTGVLLLNGQLQYDLGMLGASLLFVASFSEMIIEPPDLPKPLPWQKWLKQ